MPNNAELSRVEWSTSYVLTKALSIELLESGRLVATNSVSRQASDVPIDALPVLMSFSKPTNPHDAFQELRQKWEFSEEEFDRLLQSLLTLNFLKPSDNDAAVALVAGGFGSVIGHHRMIRDTRRVMAYQAAINRYCQGRHVVDIGSGTGVLGLFAAKAGARRVTAIEEASIAAIIPEMFQANGFGSLLDLRVGSSFDTTLEDAADVIVHEIIGIDPFFENVLPVIRDAKRRLLRADGRLIPGRLQVLCVGCEVADAAQERSRYVAEAREFEKIYGLDFSALRDALAGLDDATYQNRISLKGSDDPPRILTDECLLYDIELGADFEHHFLPVTNRLKVRVPGTLGAVIVYFRAILDSDLEISNSPFAPPTSWGRDARWLAPAHSVDEEDDIAIQCTMKSVDGRHRLQVERIIERE